MPKLSPGLKEFARSGILPAHVQTQERVLVMDAVASGTGAPVLVIDMDRTLLRSDTLHEALFAFVSRQPWRFPVLFGWLRLGRAEFKKRLADELIVDPAGLPVNETVIELIGRAREAGRRIVLVSAAEQRQVDAVAAHLGLFDEAHGTGLGTLNGANLGGKQKAAFLVERFGRNGFDYVGDSRADLAVWASARRATTIGARSSLRAAADRVCVETEHLCRPDGFGQLAHYLRSLRPHQWLKNALVFMPALAAHEPAALTTALVAFIAFSLSASSVYLVNDLLDLSADRAHPRKRLRPFAAGAIPLMHGMMLAPLLVGAAVLLSLLFLPWLFLGVLVLYFFATFAYSLVLKRKLIIDIWTLAGLYTLRVLAGAAATGVSLSFWMLAFSMFLFLSLAAVKRQAELADQLSRGQEDASGRAYRTDDLPIIQGIALAAGYAAVIVFALYVNSPEVLQLYSNPGLLWLVCPLLLYWISRMVMVTHRGRMTDDPIVFAVRDRVSCIVIALSASVVVAAGLL